MAAPLQAAQLITTIIIIIIIIIISWTYNFPKKLFKVTTKIVETALSTQYPVNNYMCLYLTKYKQWT